MPLIEIITPLHKSTRRDYIGRMVNDKVRCSELARQYGVDFWDGDRSTGYGGYRYDGRWRPVAERIAAHYGLKPGSRVLDVGCGKGFLLYELTQVVPGVEVAGFDVSRYAIEHAKEEIRDRLYVARAEDPYAYPDGHFDLVLSIMTLFNLVLPDLHAALKEIERVGRNKFVVMESYRSVAELFNLQCWALTCETFLRPEAWEWMFNQAGYTGDYEFAFFE